jgi:nicotinamidase-related amidase
MSRTGVPVGREVEIPEIPVVETLSMKGGSTAVIVVDMQNDFVRVEGALPVEAAAETVPVIAELLGRARQAGAKVVYTQDTHTEDDREFEIWPRHCVRGTGGWEIVEELKPQEGELVFEKSRYDGFYQTSLEHYLSRVWKVEAVVIVGTVANICVGQTAASAGLRWFEVVVAADGISALTAFDQAAALRQISMLYNGTVVGNARRLEFI